MDPRDSLWKLLGNSPLKEADAWFLTRVVARCRQEQNPFYVKWLNYQWHALAALACSMVLALSFWNAEVKAPRTASIQEALNYLADGRAGDSELWFE